MSFIYPFTTAETPERAQVGGKAMSLIATTRHGFPVPAGFVLSVAFFEPWIEHIRVTPEWAGMLDGALNGKPEALKRHCQVVKSLAMELELDSGRKTILADALASLQIDGETTLFAVRSSSPEEDGETDSFAGMYETMLGVKPDGVESALRQAFASCLDERVLAYKREHGFDLGTPRIAVIVQQQIASETSGVAFSMNPINNAYDEAVINANLGLGESVVSGLVTPDTFVVDKLSRTILERKVGAKEHTVWLDGHNHRQHTLDRSRLCLSDDQVLALTDMLVEVEAVYQKPVDIEWAFAGGRLALLQARPITGYFPLPDVLLTAPGASKQLYVDLTLVKWGMDQLVSVMGTDYLAITNEQALKFSMGDDIGQDTIEATRRTLEGRTYLMISNSIKAQGKSRVIGEFKEMDPLSGEILAAIDEDEYVPKKLPPALKGLMWKMVRQNLGVVWQMFKVMKDPAVYKETYLAAEAQLHHDLAQEMARRDWPSTEAFVRSIMRSMFSYLKVFMPMLIAAIMARSAMKKIFKDDGHEVQEKLVYLERALPNNVTIEMGLMMYHLARFDEIAACASGEEFVSRLEAGMVSPEFCAAWDAFMAKYGCRTPMEMDPAVPRFYERPDRFFEQLQTMADNTDAERNPQAIFDRARAEREEAYETLLRVATKKGTRKAKRFAKNYAAWIELGGYR
ncbi:MAG: hypothetical protein JXA89_03605, partial [Anaerolineae bacterium]|nr:hypothetical protein [Anaerolineae bacterium]